MKAHRESRSSCARVLAVHAAITTLLLALATTAFASGATERVIYNFTGFPDGAIPGAGLVADSAGNLYGTTPAGGSDGMGTVFQLTPPAISGGAWTKTLLYSFQRTDSDGQIPDGTLISDQQGNLYGTTSFSHHETGAGTVFELSPPATAGGAWTESILYTFPFNGRSGSRPEGKLVMDALGDLFGTTSAGGSNGGGVVFELRPPSITGSRWRELVLHNFGGSGDGTGVNNNLIMRQGVIYGTTGGGGTFGKGTVFQLKQVSGVWTESVLYSFTGSEGNLPAAGLTLDAAGNLYGTTDLGGTGTACGSGCGVVFKLAPPAAPGNPWTETTLYSFTGGADGANPLASLVLDKAGNLYGTAFQGGNNNNGAVFELSPPAVQGGAWTETTLHDFGGTSQSDGRNSSGELLFLHGTFYGTASGGTANVGAIFSVVVTP